MSGTSLDGLDIACCSFSDSGDGLSWQLSAAETIPYTEAWRNRLASLPSATAYDYALTSVDLGRYFGEQVKSFAIRHNLKADYVASHGHTVFHRPELHLTTQIGDGDALAATCGLPVVFNFRTLDVALGGQGAPLVPIGDRLLFPQYDACLNLGGIANISFGKVQRTAFDICPCNMALNLLAQRQGMSFDKDGALARSGKADDSCIATMNKLDYYSQKPPKSLGREWFEADFRPILEAFCQRAEVRDIARSAVEHIAQQTGNVVRDNNITTLLVTGGGTRNGFLVERIKALSDGCEVVVPTEDIIDYKEAIIFALLGYLRIRECDNCLASVTGAATDNCGGQLSAIPPQM